jgi:hypothetical protein
VKSTKKKWNQPQVEHKEKKKERKKDHDGVRKQTSILSNKNFGK